jgi:F0F1-type ATP synthase delta subunit
MNNTNYNILDHIRTVEDADSLYTKIDELAKALYRTETTSFQHILSSQLRVKLSQALSDDLTREGISLSDKEKVTAFLKNLKHTLAGSVVLTMTIAFSPTDENIDNLSAKAKELFGRNCILEIITQESILGGVVIVYKGKYLDKSLKTSLETAFKTASKDIEVLLSKS